MSLPPPQRPPQAGSAPLRIPQPPRPGQPQRAAGYSANQTPVSVMRETHAPTLMQFWRSDSRVIPGRRPPKWAGRAAFWLGMLALILFVAGGFLGVALLAAFATPLSVVALFFALIALIAGIGRGLGFVGLLFALAGSSLFWAWLAATFG